MEGVLRRVTDNVCQVLGLGDQAPRRKPRWWTAVVVVGLVSLSQPGCWARATREYTNPGEKGFKAIVNITYKDAETGLMRSARNEIGQYAFKSRIDSEWGWVVHVRTAENQSHGCGVPVNVPPRDRWIALIARGDCKFQQKIHNAAVIKNASAVVIYNHDYEDELLQMEQQVSQVVSIFISKKDGEKIARLVDNGTRVLMHISVGEQMQRLGSASINKTSVLFVSISFIVLMIISLAWLVFYYIQRFRYAHAKERLSKRLMNAAKKAITKMPIHTVKTGDRETDADFDQCAVCIEGYRVSDVVRILPCKHVFHKSCVDPWLVEQRSCPMCKMDILKAYGLQVHGSRDSMMNVETEGPSTSMGPSEAAHATSSQLDEAANGLMIIRYQPAQVEFHETPACPTTPSTKAGPSIAAAESMESLRSNESDSNELQSLIGFNREQNTQIEPAST